MKAQQPPRNLKNFSSWEKQALRKFELNGTRIYLVTEINASYGELITAFQIGEEPYRTPVRWKVMPEWFIECHGSNNLIGERPFEEGSITYEFLYKPLGLGNSLEGANIMLGFSDFYHFKTQLEKAGGKQL